MASEFERRAQADGPSAPSELGAFLAHNKKWWLTPILVVLLLLGGLVALGASGAAPFIYTLF